MLKKIFKNLPSKSKKIAGTLAAKVTRIITAARAYFLGQFPGTFLALNLTQIFAAIIFAVGTLAQAAANLLFPRPITCFQNPGNFIAARKLCSSPGLVP